MRKPIDPRNNGLKEPEKVHTQKGCIRLADLDAEEKVSLQTLVNAWHKVLRLMESQGQRVSEGPHFQVESYYGRSNGLVYTYEWDNLNYPVEKAAYDAAIADYEQARAAWREHEAKMKEIENTPKGLDEKIVRCERRLANLKAHKAGQPLPFPEG